MSLYCLAVAATFAGAFATCPPAETKRLSKEEYEGKVKALYADVQVAFQATRGASGAALAVRIAAAQKALRHMADELSAVKPPADVEADNTALTQAMRDYARALDRASQAAASGDQGTIAAFEDASTNAAVREMAEAAERMKHKGYRLGPIAKD